MLILSEDTVTKMNEMKADDTDHSQAMLAALGEDADAYLSAVAALEGIAQDLSAIYADGGTEAVIAQLDEVANDKLPTGFADRLPGSGFAEIGRTG